MWRRECGGKTKLENCKAFVDLINGGRFEYNVLGGTFSWGGAVIWDSRVTEVVQIHSYCWQKFYICVHFNIRKENINFESVQFTKILTFSQNFVKSPDFSLISMIEIKSPTIPCFP